MRLRPHHLLCTQGYSGKGYDKAFVENMNGIVEKLRGKEPVKIELVFYTDDLCAHCPHQLGEDLCDANEQVNRFDQKVVQFFKLKEGKYIYQELINKIAQEMTEEKMKDICSDCSWFPISSCKKNVFDRKASLCKACKYE